MMNRVLSSTTTSPQHNFEGNRNRDYRPVSSENTGVRCGLHTVVFVGDHYKLRRRAGRQWSCGRRHVLATTRCQENYGATGTLACARPAPLYCSSRSAMYDRPFAWALSTKASRVRVQTEAWSQRHNKSAKSVNGTSRNGTGTSTCSALLWMQPLPS